MDTTTTVSAAAIFLVGAASCFSGYSIFRSVIRLWGFVIGGGLAAFAIAVFTSPGGNSLGAFEAPEIIAFIVGGILGAILAVPLYTLMVFALGAVMGFGIGYYGFLLATRTPSFILALILAVVVGLFSIKFQELMIMMSTAFAGAYAIVYTGSLFTNHGAPWVQIFPSPASLPYLLVLFVVGLGGMFVQYRAEHPS